MIASPLLCFVRVRANHLCLQLHSFAVRISAALLPVQSQCLFDAGDFFLSFSMTLLKIQSAVSFYLLSIVLLHLGLSEHERRAAFFLKHECLMVAAASLSCFVPFCFFYSVHWLCVFPRDYELFKICRIDTAPMSVLLDL